MKAACNTFDDPPGDTLDLVDAEFHPKAASSGIDFVGTPSHTVGTVVPLLGDW